MKVILKYDQGLGKSEIVILEVPEDALIKMAETDYQKRLAQASVGEIVLKRTPEEIIEEWNRSEYNAWRKYHRYLRSVTLFDAENQEAFSMEKKIITNHSWREHQKQEDYEDVCHMIREILKPEQANMIIAICIDEMSIEDYALEISDKANNVSKRLNRTKRLLKEMLSQSEN